MTSISKVYWQFVLCHGLGVGLGMGLMFSPSVSTISHHFGKSKYRTLAYGCQAAGSSAGGVVFPIGLRFLLPAVGFAWGIRIGEFTLSFVPNPREGLFPQTALLVIQAGCAPVG